MRRSTDRRTLRLVQGNCACSATRLSCRAKYRPAGGRIDRQMGPGRDDVWVKRGPGEQPWRGFEDGMFAGSTVWLNWSDSAADP